jgi:hypothetical protein
VFRQDAAGVFLNLAERDGLKSAAALQAETESTDAAK